MTTQVLTLESTLSAKVHPEALSLVASKMPLTPITPPCSPVPVHGRRQSIVAEDLSPSPVRTSFSPQTRESFSSALTGGFRTLIVDDNPINLGILQRTLRRHFAHLLSPEIAIANSGNSALSQLTPSTQSPREEVPCPFATPPTPEQEPEQEIVQNPFDLILLDIDMPDISGIQVAEQIRNVHKDHSTAIVAVTTSDLPHQRKTYEMVGMDGCVGKPIDLSVLDRVVTRALLSRKRPRTSSVPPSSRDIAYRALHRQGMDLTSELGIPRSPEPALVRRSSFPLSLGEFHQIQESAEIADALSTTAALLEQSDHMIENSSSAM